MRTFKQTVRDIVDDALVRFGRKSPPGLDVQATIRKTRIRVGPTRRFVHGYRIIIEAETPEVVKWRYGDWTAIGIDADVIEDRIMFTDPLRSFALHSDPAGKIVRRLAAQLGVVRRVVATCYGKDSEERRSLDPA